MPSVRYTIILIKMMIIMMMLDRISLESLPRCWGSDLTRSLVKFSRWWGFWLQRANDDGGENVVVVMMTMTTEGWNTPKYTLNRWLLLKVHNWATILGFLTTIRFLHIQGGFFNWAAQISVLKRKTLFNQWGSFVHWEFHGTESLIGCPSFFILVLKIGRTS